MRGLRIDGGAVHFEEALPAPEPADGEVRVRVTLAGVCATDLALARGYMGFAGVPGHEFVGVAQDGDLAGRRVVGEINAGCGRCARCAAGDPRHCAERTVLGILGRGGAFAEELVLPRANLVPVPDGVPDEAAVFAEPLAAALALAEDVGGPTGDDRSALLVGDGRLGLLCAHALAGVGWEVLVLGRHPGRAALLPDGARHLGRSLGAHEDAERRHPVVVEASGRAELFPAALRRVAPRGTLALKTTTERPVEVDLARVVVDELRVVGSRCGRFAPALALLAEGRLPTDRMIADRYPLADGARALRRAAEGGVLKVLIDVRA